MTLHGRTHKLALALGAAAAAGLGWGESASAQDLPPVNEGFLSFEFGTDVMSEYWYRGIGQQNKGLIFQPHAQVNVEMGKLAGMDVTGYFSSRNVVIDRMPGMAASGTSNWYESENRVGAAFNVLPELIVDLSYGGRYAPSAGRSIVEEAQLEVRFDDAATMERMDSPVTFQPYVLLAQEIQGSSDLGGNEGTYLELGAEPGMTLAAETDFPVHVSVPASLGLSLYEYYQNADESENNFGYFDIGLRVGTEMPFVPREFGQWEIYGGVHAKWLGRSARNISDTVGTGNSGFTSYGQAGIRLTY